MARLFSRVRVQLNQAELRRLQRDPRGPVALDIDRRGSRVRNRAKQLCPVNKDPRSPGGTLAASIRKKPIAADARGLVMEVGSDVEYAIHVHQGTQPHPIHASTKAVLWWGDEMRTPLIEGEWRGAYSGTPIFIAPPWTAGYSVNHPGTKPNPFLRNALPAAR